MKNPDSKSRQRGAVELVRLDPSEDDGEGKGSAVELSSEPPPTPSALQLARLKPMDSYKLIEEDASPGDVQQGGKARGASLASLGEAFDP